MLGHISQEIEQRLIDGEQLNIRQLAKEYYSDQPEDIATTRMYSKLSSIRHRLIQDGLVIAPVSEGTFGIPQKRSDVQYAMDHYRRKVETNVVYATLLHQFAKNKNILPEGFRNKVLSLPVYNA